MTQSRFMFELFKLISSKPLRGVYIIYIIFLIGMSFFIRYSLRNIIYFEEMASLKTPAQNINAAIINKTIVGIISPSAPKPKVKIKIVQKI